MAGFFVIDPSTHACALSAYVMSLLDQKKSPRHLMFNHDVSVSWLVGCVRRRIEFLWSLKAGVVSGGQLGPGRCLGSRAWCRNGRR